MKKQKYTKWAITYTISKDREKVEYIENCVYCSAVTKAQAISDLKSSLVYIEGIVDNYNDIIITSCIPIISAY